MLDCDCSSEQSVFKALGKGNTMCDDNNEFEVWESSGCGTENMLVNSKDSNGLSEYELLDVMYDACNTSNTGEVLASTIAQYLQTLTAQNSEQERLAALRHLLDPHHQDPRVSRETFHSTMREWIAQCSQDSSDVDATRVSWPHSSKVPLNGLDVSYSENKAASSKNPQFSCNRHELSDTVAELKHAHRRLSEQNSSLLRTVAQCEDINLQLTLEITELQAKLVSAEQSAVRDRSLTEELEETYQMLKEAQERASCTQSSFIKVSNEIKSLKLHFRRLEEKSEKLTFERTCAEDRLNKLRKVNYELRAELEESLVMLMLRDREITKKDIVMEKMKNYYVENHNMIEGLLSELVRLQEHSYQLLLRYDRHCVSPLGIHCFNPPDHCSLQSEMQFMQQQHHRALDEISVSSLHTHTNDIQSIINTIKTAEMGHCLHNTCPEKDPATVQERPFPQCYQQKASIKQRLVNVLQDLERHKCVWEDKGEMVEEQQRACDKEKKQSQRESQTQIQEAKSVAVVNWWRSHCKKGVNTRTKKIRPIHALSETDAELLQAEETISDVRGQVWPLQTPQSCGQECDEQKDTSRNLRIDTGNNREREQAETTVEKVGKVQGDAAAATEPKEIKASFQNQTQPQATADGLLETLTRMEAMVSGALETAKLVRQSEERVHQVRQRMESITQMLEESLGRAVDTDEQLNALDARFKEKTPTKSPGLNLPPDPGTNTTGFMDDVEHGQGTVSAERPPLFPVFPEVQEPPELPMNGVTGRGSCCTPEEKFSLRESPLELRDGDCKQYCDPPCAAERPFSFLQTWCRPSLLPAMPTLPEEDEDSPEELDSSSSSPRTSPPGESRAVVITAPTIVYPQQAIIVQQDRRPLEQTRPHSPRARLARKSSRGSITTVDSTGNVIDLLKDQLPEPQLSEEDRQKNLELLEQAKMVSDRFLTRRGRRSTSSLTDSPTGLSPNPTPSSSPCSSRSSSLIVPPQTAPVNSETTNTSTESISQHLEVPSVREQPDSTSQDLEDQLLAHWKPAEKRKVSSGTLTPRYAVQTENCDLAMPKTSPAVNKADEVSARNPNPAPATGVAKPVPRPPTQQAPCTAEIKTIGAFPPLMRAVSWDAVGSLNSRSGAPSFPPTPEDSFSDKPRDVAFKSSGYKDLPTQPGSVQKLTKLREEHKLMRNQSIVGKLPELSEAAEQEKGPQTSPKSANSEEAKEKSDAMPNISDLMLRKLKLHRGLPGCAPPLSEKEVENAFVQLSLAFRNDNYTLETRLKQAERERNLTEENTEKELEEFKGALKMTAPQWQNLEQREAYQRLIETVAVLHRLATRLSSRAEIVGAVRQEKRMNKATEVMMQYVENLKRTYEKDHAELMEFKKLANQNSNRCYGGSVDTGDDGVPRSSRSMSLTLGKALPRRRVSVAVVPKFNLLNIPGQTPPTAGPGPSVGPTTGAALPVLCEANDVKGSTSSEATQPAAECGKSVPEQESEPAKPSINLEEIRAEIKAKIEEEAYNKGYQEGLKKSKAVQEEKCEEENNAEKLLESKNKDEESGKRHKSNRRMDEVLALLCRFCPKISISRRLLWIALTLFVVMCVVISIFTFFSDYYNRREDT